MKRAPAIIYVCALLAACGRDPQQIRVGSKKFTEGVILGELATRLIGEGAVHRRELGGTAVLWQALLAGEIDVYAEYTGTISAELLSGVDARDPAALRTALAERGLRASAPLGFDDTYAIGVRADVAERLGLRRISDLAAHPELAIGLSHEFIERADGWPGLRARYRLPHTDVRGLDHDLAYRALESGAIVATDLYSTDAEIAYYKLRVLEDDLHYFPEYQALFLYRADLPDSAALALARLAGRIRAPEMIAMNARAKLDKLPESQVAADFLAGELGVITRVHEPSRARRIWHRTKEHLALTVLALLAAVVLAVPLGVVAARRPHVGRAVLAVAGVLQTIPSLALLVFMIPYLGIGTAPALAALFLYALLPIVQNTAAGLTGIPAPLRESAEALGLPADARLRLVELPLAARSIIAGIKIAAVITVGTATLGALVGAGGYGQPIMTGIRLDSLPLILEGAIPAAVMALAAQALFDGLERAVIPRGLRARAAPSARR